LEEWFFTCKQIRVTDNIIIKVVTIFQKKIVIRIIHLTRTFTRATARVINNGEANILQ
jgi:hypothetical protein